jgi:hypothetical protein
VLVLPVQAAARALSARGAAARAAALARLSSPKADGPEADASFLLAQAAYRLATGKGAFEREASEPGSVAPGTRYSTAAALAAPRLDPALAALVDDALADPGAASLEAWVGALEAAASRGWTRELPAAEESALASRRAAAEAESLARRRRADFWRKRGALVAVLGAAVAVIALFAADMFRASKDKPDFSSLAPREIVRRYYSAVSGLDLEALEACGSSKAFEGDWNYVMNLSVIMKTRMAYEGKSPLVGAESWIAAGKPALAPTDFLSGIAGLALSREGGDASTERFRADYSFWSLDRKDDPSGDPSKVVSSPAEERRVDEITLSLGEHGWKIVRLERKVLP